jgi:alpha-L-fucosidase
VNLQRRNFLTGAALALGSRFVFPRQALANGFMNQTPDQAGEPPSLHRLPPENSHYQTVRDFIEEVPVHGYEWASPAAYEAFYDMKYGIRIHWGLYSVAGFHGESWPFLDLDYPARARYNQMYKTWNPVGFDADEWTSLFADNGMRMFAFTTKHHEGFSMWDTKTRVRNRIRWDGPGSPVIENCDLAYSIMETPFRRDVVKELTEAGHKRGLRISLYFSHPDWYDADFRPYADHPAQVPLSPELDPEWKQARKKLGALLWMAPNPTPEEVKRMMARHRAQIEELLTNYGEIDMLSLDQWLGPKVWPQLRQTLFRIRELQPNVMVRARGIGNYGDYYTPEGYVPGSKANTTMPWMVIYPLAEGFSFDPVAAHYKGAQWIVHNIIDTVAKGGSFQVGVGPDAMGRFHPTAVEQIKQVGVWMKTAGGGIYATRSRAGDLWREGNSIRYTRSKDKRTVYCYALDWPGNSLRLTTVNPAAGSRITMFGYPEPLRWKYDSATGLTINLPESMADPSRRPTQYAWGWTMQVSI